MKLTPFSLLSYSFIVAFLLLIISFNTNAQGFTGKIYFNVSSEADLKLGRVLDSNNYVMFICDTATRTDQSTPIGQQTFLFNSISQERTALFIYNGKKLAISLPKDSLPPNSLKYKTLCFKRNSIGSLNTRLARLKSNKIASPVVYTKNIPQSLNTKLPGIPGFPLEFEQMSNNGTLFVKAYKVVNTELSSDAFTVPKGYTKITWQAFENMISNN